MNGIWPVEPNRVKCITCGFAAKRARVPIFPNANRAYFELPLDERQPENLPALCTGMTTAAPDLTDIACFRGKLDLRLLVSERLQIIHPTGGFPAELNQLFREQASKDVLETDRECPYWDGYEAGRTPQEHLADYMAAELEQKRQAFELLLFELEQKAHEDSKRILADSRQLAIDSKQTVADIKSIAEQMTISAAVNDKFGRRVTFWIILLAVVQALAAIIALTKDSWIIKLLFPLAPQ